jgi:hypothetical protein
VILLHDTPDTARALPELVRRLKAQGYRFVTVTQMLARLPRPVFLASNAGTVDWEETAPAVEPPRRRRARQGGAPQDRQEKSTPSRSVVDVPTWDGPRDKAVDDPETEAV